MYSGTMIEELVEVVARAEQHMPPGQDLALSQSKWKESGEATHIYESGESDRLQA